MRVVIPGGSGQVGTLLARHFHSGGHDVTVLSRSDGTALWSVRAWDGRTLDSWAESIDGAEVVINLAGRSVNCRYNERNRREILDSRVLSTRVVAEAMSRARNPPKVWLQASTVTIYSHRFDAPNNEVSGELGGREPGVPDTWQFSIDVACAWEAELDKAITPRTRKVALRSAMTMSPDRGGIFDVLLGLTRKGLGGNAGNGKQFVSWVHDHDFLRAIDWLIARDDLSGPINISSPEPLPYAQFMKALRQAAGVSVGLPATKWMLEIGAAFMGTETELVLKSRRVVPRRLLESGFVFEYPAWPAACADLVHRWRSLRSRSTSKAPMTG